MKFDLEGWFPGQEGMGKDGRMKPESICNWYDAWATSFWPLTPSLQLQSWSDHGSPLDLNFMLCFVMCVGVDNHVSISQLDISSNISDIRLMAEILHQLICSLSHYLQGFIHPGWCRISAINSSNSQNDHLSFNLLIFTFRLLVELEQSGIHIQFQSRPRFDQWISRILICR